MHLQTIMLYDALPAQAKVDLASSMDSNASSNGWQTSDVALDREFQDKSYRSAWKKGH